MQQHIYYIKFALRFADMQIPELVNEFNSQIQNRGWSGMRAYHNQALVDEFDRRGIDNTTIRNGGSISFAHPVRYDPQSVLYVRFYFFWSIRFSCLIELGLHGRVFIG